MSHAPQTPRRSLGLVLVTTGGLGGPARSPQLFLKTSGQPPRHGPKHRPFLFRPNHPAAMRRPSPASQFFDEKRLGQAAELRRIIPGQRGTGFHQPQHGIGRDAVMRAVPVQAFDRPAFCLPPRRDVVIRIGDVKQVEPRRTTSEHSATWKPVDHCTGRRTSSGLHRLEEGRVQPRCSVMGAGEIERRLARDVQHVGAKRQASARPPAWPR